MSGEVFEQVFADKIIELRREDPKFNELCNKLEAKGVSPNTVVPTIIVNSATEASPELKHLVDTFSERTQEGE